MENPAQTRREVREELSWYDKMGAEVFALVVFVSDGFLEVGAGKEAHYLGTTKFFGIARKLPVELQMLLCRRVVGLTKELISSKDRETAFKTLATKYWLA